MPTTVYAEDKIVDGGAVETIDTSETFDGVVVGNTGTGTLTISDGGALSSTLDGVIGRETGSMGTVTVTGEDSTWSSSGGLFVGLDGTGTLTVSDGGTVSNNSASIGGRDAMGTVMVTGAASTWTNTETLHVGDLGSTGTLTIENGGAVNSATGRIGSGSGSTGTVTVSGTGSTWTNTNNLFVSDFGTGTLTIADDGVVSVDEGEGRVDIANVAGSVGTLNIGAAAGNAAVAAGTLDADTLVFGAGTGTVNFNHTEADYNFDAAISGDGTINQIAGVTRLVGDSAGFAGNTNVSGGTLVVNNALGGAAIMVNGGALSVEDGGVVSNANGVIGDAGTVMVAGAGSIWANSDNLTVGAEGNGTLTIENGGAVSNDIGFIGRDVGSTGTVVVTGANSTWTNSENLFVGNHGAGTLTIADGGAVSSFRGSIASTAADNVGTVTVTGTDSTWTNSDDLIVGMVGSGTLTIEDGGAVSNDIGFIGGLTGSTGTVIVADTGSTWTNSSDLSVGNAGEGVLLIADGGSVSNNSASIGKLGGSTGTVSVTGANSTWTNFGDIVVGNLGTGTLTIAEGGTVTTNSGGGTLSLALVADSTGALNIGAATGDAAAAAGRLHALTLAFGAGTGILNFNHTDVGYTFGAALVGSGTINQIAGVTNLAADSSAFNGTTTISGGLLNVNNALGGTVNVTGGRLGGSGTLGNLRIASGGTVAPGNSIGTLSVSGDFTLDSGSTLLVELNDGGNVAGVNNDLVDVTGTATIEDGAIVRVTPVAGSGTNYADGTTYTIVRAGTLDVQGTQSLTDDYAYLNFALGQAGNALTLTSNLDNALGQTFALAGMSRNQRSTATGVFTLGAGKAVFDQVLNMSESQAFAAMNALSGEVHASARTVLLDSASQVRSAVLQRSHSTERSEGQGVWFELLGGRMNLDGNSNAAALDSDEQGLLRV